MTAAKGNTHYFGIHYKMLCFLGIGKFHYAEENNFNNYPPVYSIYAFLCTFINIIGYTLSETVYAYREWGGDKDRSVQFFALTMVGVHGFQTIKTLILIRNNKKIQKIVRVLEIDSKKFKVDEDILKKSTNFTKLLTYGFLIMGTMTISCMAIFSMIQNITKRQIVEMSNYTIYIRRDTPFTAYVPWNTDDDLPYLAGFIYCLFGMYWMGTTLMVCDTMVASIMAHISGQFEMVQKVMVETGNKALDILEQRMGQQNLKRIENKMVLDRKVEEIDWDEGCDFSLRKQRLLCYFNEEDFNLAMIHCLKEAIQYHQLIIEITEDLQNAYSQAFLCQTLSSFYVIGLILVQAANDLSNIYSLQFYNTLGFLLSILWQLFIQTYTANEITSQAEKVASSAYACRWYSTDKRVGRLLIILLQKAQRPMVLTAGNFAAMSNKLFLSIIKTSYQIFTLITTVMTTEK